MLIWLKIQGKVRYRTFQLRSVKDRLRARGYGRDRAAKEVPGFMHFSPRGREPRVGKDGGLYTFEEFVWLYGEREWHR